MPRQKKTEQPPENQPAEVQEAKPEEKKQQTANDLFRIGYTVGIQKDGQFFWNIFGSEQEFMSLLGIHEYASTRVKVIKDSKLIMGDRLIQELGNLLVALNQKLDTLISMSRDNNKL